jgi:autotransporter family porin
MVGQNGGTFNIQEFTGHYVQLSSGSTMMNQDAAAGVSYTEESTFVDGSDSTWQVDGTFTVNPAAGVFIRRKGQMTIGTAVFDQNAGGVLTATNEESMLTIKQAVTGNASVNANDGAQVTISSAQLSSGSVLTSDGVSSGGVPSQFKASGLISGQGRVNASNGGQLSAQDVSLTGGGVFASGGGKPNTVQVQINDTMTLNGADLEVSDGASVTAPQVSVSSGGSVGVSGSGSNISFDMLRLGDLPGSSFATLGDGGKLAVPAGGTNWIASASGSIASMRVTGSGQIDASQANEFVVGKMGTGSLSISDNGQLKFGPPAGGTPGQGTDEASCQTATGPNEPESPKFVIASDSGSKGTVTLTGPNVQAEVQGERFYVGDQGGEGMLVLQNGAQLNLGVILMTLGKQQGAKGTLRLDGPGSMLQGIQTGRGVPGAKLEIGRFGEGVAQVVNGADLKLPSIILGCFGGSTGTVQVMGKSASGTPSMFEPDGSITIGSNGNGVLQISDGGQVSSYNNAVIGRFGPGRGSVSLLGADSKWTHTVGKGQTMPGNFVVGMAGTGTLLVGDMAQLQTGGLVIGSNQMAVGTMVITNGAVVNAGGMFVTIGQEQSSTGTLILDGADSQLLGIQNQNNGSGATLEIGRHGDGTLALSNSASMKLPSVILGSLDGATGTVKVGTNSVFQSDGSITIGGVSTGIVEVTTAGRLLSSNNAIIGRDVGSYGSVTLKGDRAQWMHSASPTDSSPGDVVVGQAGTGKLQILQGSQFKASTLVLGKAQNGSGEVTVSDSGTHMTLANLLIGVDPSVSGPSQSLGTGNLTITQAGLLEVLPSGPASTIQVVSPAGKSSILSIGLAGRFIAKKSALELGGDGATQITAVDGAD